MSDNPDGPYASDKERLLSPSVLRNDESVIMDAESIKAEYVQKRRQVFYPIQGKNKKTKALTAQGAITKDFDKQIIYCPLCQGFGRTQRMYPYQLKLLIDRNPAAYAELVGGLPLPDETIFLHCSNCNLRLIPEVDEVEKLDARTEDEYEITSIADTRANRLQKPVLAGQSTRYNRARKNKQEIVAKRKREAMRRVDEHGKETTPQDSTSQGGQRG
jgi:hypothetical protein